MIKTLRNSYKFLGTMSNWAQTKWDIWKFYVSNGAKSQPWHIIVEVCLNICSRWNRQTPVSGQNYWQAKGQYLWYLSWPVCCEGTVSRICLHPRYVGLNGSWCQRAALSLFMGNEVWQGCELFLAFTTLEYIFIFSWNTCTLYRLHIGKTTCTCIKLALPTG